MWKKIACLWMIALAGPAAGAVCVDASKSSCAETIQQGLLAATPGETLRIAKGVYRGPLTVDVPGVSLVGASGAVIEGDPEQPPTPSLSVAASGVTLEGLTFRLATSDAVRIEPNVVGTTARELRMVGPAGACVRVSPGAHDTTIARSQLVGCRGDGVSAEQVDGLVVRDVEMERLRGSGLYHVGGSGARILGNVFHGGWSECLYLSQVTGAEVSRNSCVNVNGYGIYMEGSEGIITENHVEAAGSLGIRYGCDGCSGGEVSRNEVFKSMGVGITIDRYVADGEVRDNLVVSARGDCYRTGPDTRRVELRGNRAEGCEDDGFDVAGQDHRVVANSAGESGRDGFKIEGSGTSVTNCEAIHNQEDGFDVVARSAPSDRVELRSNRAERNLGVGVEVSAGVTNAVVRDNTAEQNGRADACDAGTGTDPGGNRFDREEVPSGPDCPVD